MPHLEQAGTPRYMPPEIINCLIGTGSEDYLHVDVYAAGLILWDMLSRTKPPHLTDGEHTLLWEGRRRERRRKESKERGRGEERREKGEEGRGKGEGREEGREGERVERRVG